LNETNQYIEASSNGTNHHAMSGNHAIVCEWFEAAKFTHIATVETVAAIQGEVETAAPDQPNAVAMACPRIVQLKRLSDWYSPRTTKPHREFRQDGHARCIG
jgi:hypothetical protein